MNKKQKKILLSIIFCVVSLVTVEIIVDKVTFPNSTSKWIELILFLIPYLIIGNRVLLKALKNILKGKVFDENFLMTIATIGAFCLGEYRDGVAVMLFYQVGELFEMYAVNKSRKSISALMDIRPDYANIVTEDGYEKVDPYEVAIGQQIIVLPGERIPLDGVIVEGQTYLDTSALTGESVPRKAIIGDNVLSGCINNQGAITILVEKEFDDSTVAKILDLVENASSKKAAYENFITRFAKYYTPIVVACALIVAIVPPLVMGGDFSEWINRALIFLLISCPCALVISVPLSFFGGIGAASKNGILVKGSNYLEVIAKTDIIVFDKTGTLTQGVFSVGEIVPANNEITKEKLLELAAYGEAYSNHPIGISLKEAYKDQTQMEVDKTKVTNVEEISGKGLKVEYEQKQLLLGNEKLMCDLEVEGFKKAQLPGTIVYIACQKEYLGCINISDKIKDGVKEAIQNIKSMKVRKTVMLTGDSKQVALEVGRELGIDEIQSELLPEDKLKYVEMYLEEIQGTDKKLAYVGDGINDAPVLTRADVGIAMGALGQDAAIEAADIVLMDDDPGKIKTAYEISLKTLSIVKQNIVFALGIKVLFMILGVFGIASMWMAIFADVGVSVIAILNAMRALRK